jgi:hypothetical protein
MSKNRQNTDKVQYLEPHEYSVQITPLNKDCVFVPILIDKIKAMKITSEFNRYFSSTVAYNQALTEVIALLETGEDDDNAMNQGNDYPS